jgi:predicted ATP-dependent serine protease
MTIPEPTADFSCYECDRDFVGGRIPVWRGLCVMCGQHNESQPQQNKTSEKADQRYAW